MLLASSPRVPTDEELRDSIQQEKFPQYHVHKGEKYPRTSAVLKLHPDSLHRKVHFGECDEMFLSHVERTAIEGVHIHDHIRTQINQLLQKGALKQSFKPRHDAFDKTENPDAVALNDLERIKIRRCLSWLTDTNPTVLHPPEQTIVSTNLGYGGSPDLIYAVRGKGRHSPYRNVVVDFKTGQDVKEVNWMQVESYGRLIEDVMGLRIDVLGVLILGRIDKEPRLFTRHPSYDRFQGFRRHLAEWNELFPEPFDPAPPADMTEDHSYNQRAAG